MDLDAVRHELHAPRERAAFALERPERCWLVDHQATRAGGRLPVRGPRRRSTKVTRADTASTPARRRNVPVSLTAATSDGSATPSYRMMGLTYMTILGVRITVRIYVSVA